jgi:uncharacterized protein
MNAATASDRWARLDGALEEQLWETGFARAGRLLSPAECRVLRDLYADPERFRSRIEMARYRFGRGEYQYFCEPLPALVQELRENFYARLAPIASDWMTALGKPEGYPSELAAFVERCKEAGQVKPTPLLLKYEKGDFNCLHQDVYGAVTFPFQVILALSAFDSDYRGGELLLVEQLPRAQSKGQAIVMEQGEAVVITTRYRPVRGTRGMYRVNVRHGVSPVREGHRFTLGVIFHNAE